MKFYIARGDLCETLLLSRASAKLSKFIILHFCFLIQESMSEKSIHKQNYEHMAKAGLYRLCCRLL